MSIRTEEIHRAIKIFRNEGPRRFIQSIRDWLEYHPPLFEQRLRFRTWLNRRQDPSIADPFKILYIDPGEIKRASRFNSRKYAGQILGGDWDLEAHPFEERVVYRGLYQRFVDGRDWTETIYYHNALEKLDKNGQAYGCWSPEELLSVQCEYLDGLYSKIEQEGYKQQSEISSSDQATHRNTQFKSDQLFHEVTVSIGRDGEYMFDSGNHRLSISKILGIDKIPVQVVVRHKEWQKIRQQVYRNQGGATALSHADLADVR